MSAVASGEWSFRDKILRNINKEKARIYGCSIAGCKLDLTHICGLRHWHYRKRGKIILSDLKTRLGIKSPTLQILSSVRSYKESTTVMGWGTPFPHHITEFIQIEDRIPQAQTRAMEQFFMFKFMLQGPRIFFLPRMHVYSLIL